MAATALLRTGPRGLLLPWVLLTTLGVLAPLNVLVILLFSTLPASTVLSGPLSGVVFGLLSGAQVGACQWLVLKRIVRRAGWWLPVTGIGWGLDTLAALAARSWLTAEAFADLLPAVTLAGALLLGLGQWLILRTALQGAVVWVGVPAASRAAGVIAASVASGALAGYPLLAPIAGGAVGVVVAAAVSGSALVWLVGQTHADARRDAGRTPRDEQ
jgi:hypothetical protein